ncbi:MAG TPA: energy transducer TonB [Blastocatellia bacterium]|nr:energy transducer TonB [Blastocatellia bacterium]
MKKTFGAALLVILALVCRGNSQTRMNDLEFEGLAGPVRAIRVEQARVLGGTAQEGPRELFMTATYNSEGRVIDRIFYYHGRIWSKISYSYDSDGTRNDVVYRRIPGTPDPPEGTLRLTGEHYTVQPIRMKRVFKWDAAGNVTELVDYSSNGEIVQRITYRYDGKRNQQEVSLSFGDRPIWKATVTYGKHGEVIQAERQDLRGSPAEKETYSYEFDSIGNWTKRIKTVAIIKDGEQNSQTEEIVCRQITYANSNAAPGQRVWPDRSIDLSDGSFPGFTRPFVIRKSGGVLQGEAEKKATPTYPLLARDARVSGQVVVEITIDERGKVMDARVISGPEELRDAALSASWLWTFRPTKLSGVPVVVIGRIIFNFSL